MSAFLGVNNFDAFAVTETWLTSNVSVQDSHNMNGYHLPLLKNRTHCRDGGVALYLKNCLSYKRRFELEMPNLKLLWCEVLFRIDCRFK
jgi:hypothetical protein